MPNIEHAIIKGSERILPNGARAIGAADEHAWVEVTVKLKRKQALPAVEKGKTWTREQLASAHGATEDDVRTVSASFERFGLEVVDASAANRSIRLGGTVAAMEQAFQVKLVRYQHPHGNFRGRLGPLRVPAEVADKVQGVFGLDNRAVVKPRRTARATLSPEATQRTTKNHPWFFPADLAKIYDFPAGDGAGQSIAILEFGGGFFADDLQAFNRLAGVQSAAPIDVISVDHAATNARDGAEGEVMLDVEVIAGIAPQAKLGVYFSSFTEKGWVDVLDRALHDARANSVISVSWGTSEDGAWWTDQAIAEIDELFHEAALAGVTVCVAAGDDGSDDQVGDGQAHVDFPASSPYVLAVGGTTLRAKSNKVVSEVAWKDGDGLRADGGGSTGGGVSVRFPPIAGQPPIASVNPGAAAGRVVPDVAANASANTGYVVVVDGKPGISGGTSASAPLWAALIALVNASLGSRVGYLTAQLYESAQAGPLGARVCRDIVKGDNITAAIGGYVAKESGFDAVTGWGAPIGSALLAQLKAARA